MTTLRVLLCMGILLLPAYGSGAAGYLKDWHETRVVVEISGDGAEKLPRSRAQIENDLREYLAQERVGPTVTDRSHSYLYLRFIAGALPARQYFGVLEVRVVRPVVVVPIGKVAVAGVWERSVPLTGPLRNFAADLRGGLRDVLTRLKEDWRLDNPSVR